jgi:hypothetical protein
MQVRNATSAHCWEMESEADADLVIHNLHDCLIAGAKYNGMVQIARQQHHSRHALMPAAISRGQFRATNKKGGRQRIRARR